MKFDFLGLKTLTVLDRAVKLHPPARHRDRSRAHPARRREDLRHAVARRGGRHLPGGKCGHAQGAGRHEARPYRGHYRAGGALPPRPDGEHPDLQCAQARRGGDRLDPSQDRSSGEGNPGRHRLPGTGDADRAGASRIFARRSRPSAPRHGQEDPRRDGRAARAFRRAAL